MTSNKSMLDRILEAQAELVKNCPPLPKFPLLPKPDSDPKSLEPGQEEMDKLASVLTEAVLQLHAGDMEGARDTLDRAGGLCGVQIRGTPLLPTDHPSHYLDALRYGMEVIKQEQHQPPERVMTATEQLLRQEVAKHKLDAVQREFMKSLNNANPAYPLAYQSVIKDPEA